jgi:uncharacterized hydrophobic protein (TIGR00271 family)
MLVLQVYAPATAAPAVLSLLGTDPAVEHVVRGGVTEGGGQVSISADVRPGAVDTLLPRIAATGVPGDDIVVVHRDSSRPMGQLRTGDVPSWSGGALAWTELAMASRQYARAVPQYLTFMTCAGVIAAFGVLTRSTTLIVGAMAIAPDLLPLCATCVGIVDRRGRLASRAFAALLVGLLTTMVTAFVVTSLLRAGGYGPTREPLGNGGLGILPSVSVATVVVAFAAGIAGILAFETRASSSVGVAISITTIPAAAYVGVALAQGDTTSGWPGLAVLGVNIATLVLSGTGTLLLQRALHRPGVAELAAARGM